MKSSDDSDLFDDDDDEFSRCDWAGWRDEPTMLPPTPQDDEDDVDRRKAREHAAANPVADPATAAAAAFATAEAGDTPLTTKGNQQ
jgi:hypothetical protein